MIEYKIKMYQIKSRKTKTIHSLKNYALIVLNQPVTATIKDKMYSCNNSDFILIKPEQSLYLYTEMDTTITVVYFSVELLLAYSEPDCNLLEKFQFVPYEISIVHGGNDATMLMKNLITRLYESANDEIDLGASVYRRGIFSSFLVIFLRTCVASDRFHQANQKKKLVMDDVFHYISHHLADDLSLQTLEKVFFISGEHISREFKKHAGITLHAYITKSRIDLAKKYIISGKRIQEVYPLCGFGSYNHFFKAFKKECQMTPCEYYKSLPHNTDL